MAPFAKDLEDVTVVEKATATLECELAFDKEVKWFKDGRPIKIDKEKYDVEAEGNFRRLIIKSTTPKDGAEYTVHIAPKKESKATLTVKG